MCLLGFDDSITETFHYLVEHDFRSVLLSNREDTGVRIEYRKDLEMKLGGLHPDNPPFVWFASDKISISEDGEEYKQVGYEYGLQVLRLLDPRVILDPRFKVRIVRLAPNGMILEYDLLRMSDFLKFPIEFVKRMASFGELRRHAILSTEGNVLKAITQRNLPPSNEEITLVLSYQQGFPPPSRPHSPAEKKLKLASSSIPRQRHAALRSRRPAKQKTG